jgi:hypothetical protein
VNVERSFLNMMPPRPRRSNEVLAPTNLGWPPHQTRQKIEFERSEMNVPAVSPDLVMLKVDFDAGIGYLSGKRRE